MLRIRSFISDYRLSVCGEADTEKAELRGSHFLWFSLGEWRKEL